jgi:hypothetical protein
MLAPFAGPAGLDKTYIAAIVTIPVVLVVWILVRRIRQRLGHRAE